MNVDIQEKERIEKKIEAKMLKTKIKKQRGWKYLFLLVIEQEISDFLCV